jgi:hypothetical protein
MNRIELGELVLALGTKRRMTAFCEKIDLTLTRSANNTLLNEELEEVFAEWEIESINKMGINTHQTLANLRTELVKVPVVTLYLAFEPPVRFVTELITFFHERIKELHVLEIIIDDSLIAGAVVQYKGFHSDYSWLSLIKKSNY